MVNGIPEVQAMFRRKAAKVAAAAKAQARVGGEQVASAMRYLAPREQGELIRSIRVEDAASISTSKGERGFIGVVVKAGDETTIVTNESGGRFQNAKLQEHGTKNMPANPYFNPAWRANRSRVRSAISRAVRKAWASG
uniref:HK97-gp10 family putative phage morphogenesis protein n=1 Tax=Paracoccus sp. TRP TaxID=412597 RepID=UPI000225F13F|nr:HK97-gp10 family putative phage morphogenesis protein [Paracoccus sp. TRP]